ncbi:interferon beta [Castor canadensis]|uniref:Interferon beta n=1 Tax=Castor canadensis TaxID=51338 RepID=A0AC58KTP4_CASCN
MTNRCVFHVALLLCFSTTALSRSYRLLRLQQNRSSMACQKLLTHLNGRPESCIRDRMDFEVPEEIKLPQQLQKEDAAFIIYEMLHNVLEIFTRDLSNTGWDEAIIRSLFVQVHQQMDRLRTTLAGQLEEVNLTWGNVMTTLQLKSYYWRIIRYLKDKEYSSCAWTVVCVEILRNFSFINRLTDFFQK